MSPEQEAQRYLAAKEIADALAAGQTIEHTHVWSRWEKISFCSAWFLTGLAAGAVITAIVDYIFR